MTTITIAAAGDTNSSTTATTIKLPDHSRSLWRSRLSSALRTALACGIVGITTLYSPPSLRQHLKFPAFSYLTAVLIVSEATLGESLKGAVQALYGTVLGAFPALLTLYFIQPGRLSAVMTAVAVAISSFAVAISDSSGLIAKRVALGQIVIVYVASFMEEGNGKPILHPIPVAASTAVGAMASVLALVIPYPRLAYHQVRVKEKFYTDIAMERLRILVNAFCAEKSSCTVASISQAKSLTAVCTKFLRDIKLMQGSILWERPPFKFFSSHSRGQSDTLQAIEIPLKGMEIALNSTTSFTIKALNQQLKDDLISIRDQISTKLHENNCKTSKIEMTDKTFKPFSIIPETPQGLPFLFFLFCVKLLKEGTLTPRSPNSTQDNKVTPTTDQTTNSRKEEEPSSTKRSRKLNDIWAIHLSTKRVISALKCSLSLGLAVLFGVLFKKDNGYWSGLTVAVAFTPWRDGTFKLASVRAHGTALGSVYGVLIAFTSQNFMELRLLALLPWIIFTSFLQRSRMYGQVGAFAATISAMIILGRRNYGSPIIFAIDRLTETYIGLGCSIFVELLLQPTRASTLARRQLSGSLQTLHECIQTLASSEEVTEEEKLRKQVNQLKKYIREAETEPNFWFLPFPIDCYNKLHNSCSKIVELLPFLALGMELLVQESPETKEIIKGDVDHFKKSVAASVKCYEEVIQVRSLARVVKELQRTDSCSDHDIEIGKGQLCSCRHGDSMYADVECEKIVVSFLRHGREAMERLDDDVDEESKNQVVLCLASIGFCIESLMREMREMEKGILELLQWENPSCHINLYEISSKVKDISI